LAFNYVSFFGGCLACDRCGQQDYFDSGTVRICSVGNADKTASRPALSTTFITASGARFDVSGFTGATTLSPAIGDTNFIAASAEL
jgi:hypothetical protein